MGFALATGSHAALCLLTLLAAGCSSSQLAQPPPVIGTQCVDDSSHCIGQRQSALRSIMDDKSRSWVRQPADARAYASGVRLFAYKTKKKELSCEELSAGRKEADGAPGVLRGPQAAQLTPAQASRGIMLAGEVSRELGNEFSRRCKKT